MEHVETPHSSNVTAYDYEPGTQTLTIHFKGGSSYDYAGFPAHKFALMKSAMSIGTFVHQHVKGQHPATKRR